MGWGGGDGEGQRGGGDGEGGNRKRETEMVKQGGVEVRGMAGSTEKEKGRVRLGGGNGKGKTGKGQTGGGGGIRRGKRRRHFTDGYEMVGWNEVREFSDFVYPCNAGYPSFLNQALLKEH